MKIQAITKFLIIFILFILYKAPILLAKNAITEIADQKETSPANSKTVCDNSFCRKTEEPPESTFSKVVSFVMTHRVQLIMPAGIFSVAGYLLWKKYFRKLSQSSETPPQQSKNETFKKQSPKRKSDFSASIDCNGFSCLGPVLVKPLSSDQLALNLISPDQLALILNLTQTEIAQELDPETGFSEEDIIELNLAADELMELSSVADTLLFLGRSPLWISEILRIKKKHRRQVRVAFSGSPIFCESWERRQNLSRQSIMAFRNYLVNLGITPQSILQIPGHLVIIDFISSGKSMSSFLQILLDWCSEMNIDPEFILKKFKVIRLAHEDRRGSAVELQIQVEVQPANTIFINRSLLSWLSECAPMESIGFSFHHWSWNDPEAVYTLPCEYALRLQQQLEKYLSKQQEH